MRIRQFKQEDTNAVLALINSDHILGQPLCSQQHLRNAIAGRAKMEEQWWSKMKVHTLVATTDNEIVGAASFGICKAEREGFILWIHAEEQKEVIGALIEEIMSLLQRAGCSTIHAFWFSTPLTWGLEALPVKHRSITHKIMLEKGFSGEDAWLYMIGSPVGPAGQEVEAVAEVKLVEDNEEGCEWQLTLPNVGKATIGMDKKEHMGVLWWIDVEKSQQGHGWGKRIFRQAMKILAGHVQQVILYVDHDNEKDRPRSKAIEMYRKWGFEVVDHLWQYTFSYPH